MGSLGMIGEQIGSDEQLAMKGLELGRSQCLRHVIRAVELADGSWVELPLMVVRGVRPITTSRAGASQRCLWLPDSMSPSRGRAICSRLEIRDKVVLTELKTVALAAGEIIWRALTLPGSVARHKTSDEVKSLLGIKWLGLWNPERA